MSNTGSKGFAQVLAKGVGALLLVLTLVPFFRVFDLGGKAAFRQGVVEAADAALQSALWGSLIVGAVALGLAIVFGDRAIRFGATAGRLLARPPLPLFSVLAGVLAFSLAFGFGQLLHDGMYTSVDEMVSAIHARYLASGALGGPALPFPEAWLIPNSLMVEVGWVSQYPPSHLLILAAFFRFGMAELAGPVLLGIMVWLLALSYPRLIPGEERATRVAGLLTALSPFLLFLGAGGLSHLTAGAAGAAVLYTALRARDGRAAWGIALGAAIGIMVSARPLVGLVLGVSVPATLWGPQFLLGQRRGFGKRLLMTAAGGVPFAILLGWYNHRLFGHWLRFGYTAAFGESHGLGFHTDPWGYMYGLGEAVGFTSIDLLGTGNQLLETPIPLTLLLGAYLMFGPRLPRGGGTLLAWGFLPVLANAAYWFHDPRMLFEAAPAWLLLSTLAVVGVIRHCRDAGPRLRRVAEATAWGVVVALSMALAWGVPTRWNSYKWSAETLGRIRMPPTPPGESPLVFVHTSWDERLSSGLQGAAGVRQDTVVNLLHRATSCQLHRFAQDRRLQTRTGGADGPQGPEVALPSLQSPEGMMRLTVGPGIGIRTLPGERISPACQLEIRADRYGAVALAPLLWQGDLPGAEKGLPMFVRDHGPEANDLIVALFSDREPYVFTPVEAGASPVIVPYQEGMEILWGGEGTED